MSADISGSSSPYNVEGAENLTAQRGRTTESSRGSRVRQEQPSGVAPEGDYGEPSIVIVSQPANRWPEMVLPERQTQGLSAGMLVCPTSK